MFQKSFKDFLRVFQVRFKGVLRELLECINRVSRVKFKSYFKRASKLQKCIKKILSLFPGTFILQYLGQEVAAIDTGRKL